MADSPSDINTKVKQLFILKEGTKNSWTCTLCSDGREIKGNAYHLKQHVMSLHPDSGATLGLDRRSKRCRASSSTHASGDDGSSH